MAVNPLHDLFRYHHWAMVTLVDWLERQPVELIHEHVVGTERTILQTLTHVVGNDENYLDEPTGEVTADAVRAGQVLSLAEVRRRNERVLHRWLAAVEVPELLERTIPARVRSRRSGMRGGCFSCRRSSMASTTGRRFVRRWRCGGLRRRTLMGGRIGRLRREVGPLTVAARPGWGGVASSWCEW